MKLTSILLLLLLEFFSVPVFALRCEHHVIEINDSTTDVLRKCGEPYSIDSHVERRTVSSFAAINDTPVVPIINGQQYVTEVDVNVEEWVYDYGRTRMQQYLRFENGRVKETKALGRGEE